MSRVRVAIALGSNLGERRAHLEAALRALDATPGLERVAHSSWHETAPVGGPPGQGAYLNGVALYECALDARALLARLQAIEAARGRDREREGVHGARPLDLDLLLYGEEQLEEADLIVPHPRMEERAFVLAPLCELWPDCVLARSGLPARERLAQLVADAP